METYVVSLSIESFECDFPRSAVLVRQQGNDNLPVVCGVGWLDKNKVTVANVVVNHGFPFYLKDVGIASSRGHFSE